MSFIILTEVVWIGGQLTEQPVYVKVNSVNLFKVQSGGMLSGDKPLTQVMLQNDCVWVKESPEAIMELMDAAEGSFFEKFGLEDENT